VVLVVDHYSPSSTSAVTVNSRCGLLIMVGVFSQTLDPLELYMQFKQLPLSLDSTLPCRLCST